MIPYPSINPVAVQLGPLAIRWYSLSYIAGILLGWLYVRRLHRQQPVPGLNAKALDDLMLWMVMGVVGGGRLGYVLFYKPGYYFANPLHIFTVWQGGMSFHGGLLGVFLAIWIFCRKYRIPYFAMMDVLACATPIGLFLGRLANFINGELFGRVTDVPWAMVFPQGGPLPRHPSQLYEAGLEGIALFAVLYLLTLIPSARRRVGVRSGAFLIGYALARMAVECFREPDAFLGYLFGFITMGQLLCLPMLALGIFLIARAKPYESFQHA